MKTPQRNSVLNYLKNNTSHPTAREIYDAISKKDDGVVSLATVYNTLSLMKKKGLVRELAITDLDYKRYDPNVSPHAHLICGDCGKIVDVRLPFTVEIPEEQKQGFDIRAGDIHFYGLCPACRNKEKNPAAQ
ncbi:MAG: transcriptional repressor [Deltaproteobacteria bacterium]|nr:transcriptional repressor [Deltaproteobacteria bacterium]